MLAVLSNELPRLAEASGALADRHIILQFRKSFAGKEDLNLFRDRLRPELGGILNWSLAGWERLQKRARLIQPQSALELVDDFDKGTSGIRRFISECCTTGPDQRVDRDRLFSAWKLWCGGENRKDAGTREDFGRNLRAALDGNLGTERPRGSGEGRKRVYVGVDLVSEFYAEPPES